MQFLDGMKIVEVKRPLRQVAERVLEGIGHCSMLPSVSNLILTEHPHKEAPLDVPIPPVTSFEVEFNTSGR